MSAISANRIVEDAAAPVAASVTALNDHKERRISKVLNRSVLLRSGQHVSVRELFCPLWDAAVVIRRRNGALTDPCRLDQFSEGMRRE